MKKYEYQTIIKELEKHNIKYDKIKGSTNVIRAYCYGNDHDYSAIEITPHGDVSIYGRIINFEEWLQR